MPRPITPTPAPRALSTETRNNIETAVNVICEQSRCTVYQALIKLAWQAQHDHNTALFNDLITYNSECAAAEHRDDVFLMER